MKRAVMPRENSSMKHYILIALLILVGVLLLVSIFSGPALSPTKNLGTATKGASLTTAPSSATKAGSVPSGQSDGVLRGGAQISPISVNHYCLGDVDRNGVVNPADRGHVAANIGCETTNPGWECSRYDLDGNGVVNAGDRGFVNANLGECDVTVPLSYGGMYVYDVERAGNFVYALSSYPRTVVVFDVSNPQHLGDMKKVDLPGLLPPSSQSYEGEVVTTVEANVDGSVLYVTTYYRTGSIEGHNVATSNLRIYEVDLEDIGSVGQSSLSATLVGTIGINEIMPEGVDYDAEKMWGSYFDEESSTIYVAVEADDYDGGVWGNFDGVYTIDVSNPSVPQVVSRIYGDQLGGPVSLDHRALVNSLKGGDDFLAYRVATSSQSFNDAVFVFDTRNPHNPVQIGTIPSEYSALYYMATDANRIALRHNGAMITVHAVENGELVELVGAGDEIFGGDSATLNAFSGNKVLTSSWYQSPNYELVVTDIFTGIEQNYVSRHDFGNRAQDQLGPSILLNSNGVDYYLAFYADGAATFRLD